MENLTYSRCPSTAGWSYSPGDKPLIPVRLSHPSGHIGHARNRRLWGWRPSPATRRTSSVSGGAPCGSGSSNPWVYVASYAVRINNIYQGLRVDASNAQLAGTAPSLILTLHPDDAHVYIARWHNRYFLPTVGDWNPHSRCGSCRGLWSTKTPSLSGAVLGLQISITLSASAASIGHNFDLLLCKLFSGSIPSANRQDWWCSVVVPPAD
jgi:hypothetical protein